MPPSVEPGLHPEPAGAGLAIAAESLYLANGHGARAAPEHERCGRHGRSLTPPSPKGRGRIGARSRRDFHSNLLLLPGISFLILLHLALRAGPDTPKLAKAHLSQTVAASLWAGGLLVVVNGLILLLGGYTGAHTWVLVILYFTVCHSALVLLGVVGLSKAMAGQCWRYPLVGRPLPAGCPGTIAHA